MAEHQATILTILSNQLLLLSTTPYLSPSDIHSLSLSCRSAYNLIVATPSAYRHLDLSVKKCCKNIPRILSTPKILRSIRTLVLDNLPVTAGHLYNIITPQDWQSEIQLLSLRGCKDINESEFMSFLSYLIRPSGHKNTLKLRGVYWFSDLDAGTTGKFVKSAKTKFGPEWVALLEACEGRIAFDTRICQGQKHDSNGEGYIGPKIANIKLGGECAGCGFSPRANAKGLPDVLVAPVPLFGRFETACKASDGEKMGDVLRCEDCVKERWCECCGKWWCEECAVGKKQVNRTCFDCGAQCEECTTVHSRTCLSCIGGYCITHNEGADNLQCEWCNAASAPRRGSYSNAFLTSPASSYYHSLGPSRPNATASKPRTVASGTPFRAATNVPIGGRQFQQEVLTRRRGLF